MKYICLQKKLKLYEAASFFMTRCTSAQNFAMILNYTANIVTWSFGLKIMNVRLLSTIFEGLFVTTILTFFMTTSTYKMTQCRRIALFEIFFISAECDQNGRHNYYFILFLFLGAKYNTFLVQI